MFSTMFRRASASDGSRVRPLVPRNDAELPGRLMSFRLVRQESGGRKVYIREQFGNRSGNEHLDWW